MANALKRLKLAVLSEFGSFQQADRVIVGYHNRKDDWASIFLEDNEIWPGYPLHDVCRYHSL
jgi:hypothetical protein